MRGSICGLLIFEAASNFCEEVLRYLSAVIQAGGRELRDCYSQRRGTNYVFQRSVSVRISQTDGLRIRLALDEQLPYVRVAKRQRQHIHKFGVV